MRRGLLGTGLLSVLTALLYIPAVHEAAGFELMAFLGSEIGSERGAVNVWYPAALLTGAALIIVCVRMKSRLRATAFVLLSVTVLIHLLPFGLWLIVWLLDAAYWPGLLMALLHGSLLSLSTLLALQLMGRSDQAAQA